MYLEDSALATIVDELLNGRLDGRQICTGFKHEFSSRTAIFV